MCDRCHDPEPVTVRDMIKALLEMPMDAECVVVIRYSRPEPNKLFARGQGLLPAVGKSWMQGMNGKEIVVI